MNNNNFDHIAKKDIHELIENCFIRSPKTALRRVVMLVAILFPMVLIPAFGLLSNSYYFGIMILIITSVSFMVGLFVIGMIKWNREQEAVIILIEHHIDSGRKFIPKRSWKLIPKEFLEKHGFN